MQVTLDKKSDTLASILVNLEEGDYAAQYNQRLKEYSKQANIKGFRPGKIPTSVVKNMVGDSLLADEVFKLLSETINNYIKENDLSIIGEPLPNKKEDNREIDWKTAKNFDFTYDIGIIPAFKYDISEKQKFTKHEVEVEDATLEETLTGLLKQHGAPTEVEAVGADDFLSGTILKDGEEGEGVSTGLPLNKVAQKEQKQFIGKKIGDTVTFDVRKAFEGDDHIGHVVGVSKEEAASVKGKYAFTVSKITRTSDAEYSQELFDKVLGPGVVSSEQEFKDKVREILTQNLNNDSRSILFKDIQTAIAKDTKLEVSEDFFKRWLLESNKGALEEEELQKNYDKYEAELKWTLIRNKIADDNELKVEDNEVRQVAVEQLRMQYLGGMEIGPEMEETFNNFVNKYLQEDKGKNYLQIFEQVLLQKVLTLIEEKVTIKGKKIKSEAFKKIVDKL